MLDRMSNASRIVDRLESKELVARTVCKSDRRAKDVVITEKGLGILDNVDQEMTGWLHNFDSINQDLVEKASDTLDAFRQVNV